MICEIQSSSDYDDRSSGEWDALGQKGSDFENQF